MVLLKREVDEEWIFATNTRSGESGIVPLSFLDIQVPLVPSSTNRISSTNFSDNKSLICWVRAIYDYETGVDGDLQVILIILLWLILRAALTYVFNLK